MTTSQISVGIVAPSPEVRLSLRGHVEATALASVVVESEAYCAMEDDGPTQLLLDSRPDIILVDMQDEGASVQALGVIHGVLPEVWLFACSSRNEPQLIIETMHAGAREFLSKPITSRTLGGAFARYLDEKQRMRGDTKIRGRIYSVTAAKGGAGATSVAINLATTVGTLSDTRVALLDLNSPVGDAAAYLNLKSQFSVADALAAAPRLDSVLLETYMSKAHNVSLLPGPKKYQPGPTPAPAALAKTLRVTQQTFTHAFIDLPSSLDPDLLKVVTDSSDSVLVVLTPELPALWRTHRLLLFLANAGCTEKLRLILNRDNSRDDFDEREIEKALNCSVYWRLPNSYATAVEAINKGKPIVSANHSSLAASYRRLAHDLTGIAAPAKKRGILGLFSN